MAEPTSRLAAAAGLALLLMLACFPDPDDLRPSTAATGFGGGSAVGGAGDAGIGGQGGGAGAGGLAQGGRGGSGLGGSAGMAMGGRTGMGGQAVGGAGGGAMGGAGGNPNAACAPFPACGGVLTGTWNAKVFCTGIVRDTTCTQATQDFSNIQFAATYTFGPDNMTMQTTVQIGGVTILNYPLSCLQNGGAGVTCPAFGEALTAEFVADAESPYNRASCTGVSVCRCELAWKGDVRMSTQRYTLNNGTISFLDPTMPGVAETHSYCITGNELKVSGEMSGTSFLGNLVLTRAPATGQ